MFAVYLRHSANPTLNPYVIGELNMLRPHPGFLSLCALFCVLALAAVSFGQDLDDVTIMGLIVDRHGSVIPGASVTLTETGTGTSRTGVTDSSGAFRFLEIEPGDYSLIVASPGFGSVERELGSLSAGRELVIEFELSPAAVTADTEVTVESSDVPDVDTTRIVVSSTVESVEIEELPNLDRHPLDLVLTVGGVSEEALSTTDLAEDEDSNPRST